MTIGYHSNGQPPQEVDYTVIAENQAKDLLADMEGFNTVMASEYFRTDEASIKAAEVVYALKTCGFGSSALMKALSSLRHHYEEEAFNYCFRKLTGDE